MKYKSIKTLYSLFSFLSDKTNGFKPFVKYKLLLGTLLIGISTTACKNKTVITCYETSAPDDAETILIQEEEPYIPPMDIDTNFITCYAPGIPIEEDIEQPKDPVIAYAEQMPSFPGGDKAMVKFIIENYRYPVKDDREIEGRVILQFVVRSTGKIDNIEVARSLDPIFDKEAIRVVKSMPEWIPGKQDGEPVDVYYRLPVLVRKTHKNRPN